MNSTERLTLSASKRGFNAFCFHRGRGKAMKTTRLVPGIALLAVPVPGVLGSLPSRAWGAGGSCTKPLNFTSPVCPGWMSV